MFSIMQSPLLFFLLCERWLLFERLLRLGTLSAPSDFRPISIVSVLSKAFERILHKQVLEQVNGHNLLSDFQSGFRHGHYIAPLRSAKADS
jgi:hypothetical protein